eukprot:1096872-Rhodomonas_salina.1
MAGDLHLPIVSNDGVARMIVVNGMLYDEDSPVDLVLVDQLCQQGFSVRFEKEDEHCCIVLNPNTEPIFFLMKCENKIFSIYSPSCDSTTNTVPDSNCATELMSIFAGKISLEELTHLRMSHQHGKVSLAIKACRWHEKSPTSPVLVPWTLSLLPRCKVNTK